MASVDQTGKNPVRSRAKGSDLLANPARLRLISWLWIGLATSAWFIDLLQQTREGLSNGLGRPFGDDFVNYWSGAFLAFHGRVAEVYDFAAFHAFEQSVTAQSIQYYHYSYPPVLPLLTLPLAFIPYVPALFVWLGATWYAFYRALKLTGHAGALLLSLAVPALFINAVGGQNGAMTAALLGGGLLLVDRRPVVAGILFGMMIYKPHLAVMLPAALLAGRRWLVVFVTGATAALLVVTSVAVYGVDAWLRYRLSIDVLRAVVLEDGTGVSHRMVSIFVFARHFGAGAAMSYAWQAVGALVAAVFIARVVARSTCSYPQRRPAHRHLSGNSLFAGLRSGVWRVRRGVAANGGDGFESAGAMDSHRHSDGPAPALGERAAGKIHRAVGRTAGLSSRIRDSDLSWCGICQKARLRAARCVLTQGCRSHLSLCQPIDRARQRSDNPAFGDRHAE